MSARPFFTVGVPTFDRADHFLPHTLGFLLRQRFTDFEVLVSENAGNDNTAEVVAGFNDPRIRYVRRPERVSPGAHFAMIAEEARGRYFVLNQDDDLLHLHFLQRAHDGLVAHPEAVLFACPIWREQPNRGYSSIALRPREGYRDENVVADRPYLIDGRYAAAKFFDLKLHFVHPALAISCDALRAVGGYDARPDHSADLVTQARVLMRGPLVYDPRPGGIFRVHAGNYSRTMTREHRKRFFRSTYANLIAVFEQSGEDWRRELDAYLATLRFEELAECVREWLYYRTPFALQELGMKALLRAWPGTRIGFLRKCASRLGMRNLGRYWLARITC
ncbi:MAG: hypothetical protein AUK49_02400 [Betaproteobacteria bacterium CG2_30_68_42]|nr:MAG: hypothetical protein AUK49_02400 [Betaproteobacteria bacterium CG2_30_68_42]